jgi:post-segregation antitoxin (ccd killing protein)
LRLIFDILTISAFVDAAVEAELLHLVREMAWLVDSLEPYEVVAYYKGADGAAEAENEAFAVEHSDQAVAASFSSQFS